MALKSKAYLLFLALQLFFESAWKSQKKKKRSFFGLFTLDFGVNFLISNKTFFFVQNLLFFRSKNKNEKERI